MRRMSLIAVTGVVAVGLTLSACGSDSMDTTSPGAGSTAAGTSAAGGGVDAALAAKVPAEMKAAGMIKVGIDPTYAPNEMLAADGKTVEGFDVDIFNAVAAKLGLKTEYQPAAFGTIILGVTGGKYDIGVSSFTINDERKKQVNMVSYYSAGTQWVVAKGNPEKVNIDDVCGKSVGAQKGTVQAEDLAARSKKCTDAGKAAITQVIQVKAGPGHRRRGQRQDGRDARRLARRALRRQADRPARGPGRHLRLGAVRLRHARRTRPTSPT